MSWRRFLRRNYWDRERSSEIKSYLEIETAENIARGMTPADAASAARRKFGNPALIREEIYHMNTVGWLESIWQDLRYGVRLLRQSPGFTAVAIASLALGIGANTAIFQLLDAVRLRNLPVKNPGELAEVKIVGGNGGMGLNNEYGELTRPQWLEIQRQQKGFAGVFAWSRDTMGVGEGSEFQQAEGIFASSDFFRVLGVEPYRGRLFLPEDEHACPESAAVVSYSYWQAKMGGKEPGPANKLMINGNPTEIIGVTPPSFHGLAVGDRFDMALPFCQPKELARNVFDVTVMGRLKPGWTIESASSQLNALSSGVMVATEITGYEARTVDKYRAFKLAAYSASTGVSDLRKDSVSSLWLLLGITGLVLLIASANLANLMLARASTREREIAVRLAMGASRGRLLRQLLAESALLAFIGAAFGIVLAALLSRLLVTSFSTDGSVDLSVSTDWRVLLFTTVVATVTCLVFGIVPALRATAAEPVSAMKTGGRGMTGGRERFSLQRFMVVAQISVSLVLLVGALLFVRSFYNLMTFDPGMREAGVTLAFLAFPQSNVPPEGRAEFKRELLSEVRSVPGILSAGTTTNAPLVGGSWTSHIRIGSAEGDSKFTWTSPGYFETMGIPILQGRGFTERDTASSTHVSVVNPTFVRRFLNGANPIGQTLRTSPEPGYPSTVYQIVGIIPDTKYEGLRGETPPMAFAPASQYPADGAWTAMMIRSNLPQPVLADSLKRRIAEKYPKVVFRCNAFDAEIQNGLARERLMAMLSGFFGLLAALLAMVGLYGVISYIVARRRNEIGIRLALGAARGQVVRMVMRDAVLLIAVGLSIGTVLSLIAGRTAKSLLFQLESYDPLTLLLAAGLLAGIAALASFLPARRAAQLDPMAALRCE
jgi:predicted permease